MVKGWRFVGWLGGCRVFHPVGTDGRVMLMMAENRLAFLRPFFWFWQGLPCCLCHERLISSFSLPLFRTGLKSLPC